MTDKLNSMENQGFEENYEGVNIAITTFAFDNSKLISLLRQRGNFIMNEKWDKAEECEKKIEDLKNENLTQFTRPVSVFMTFEDEEGVQRALEFQKWFDEKVATEWESDNPADKIKIDTMNKWLHNGDDEGLEIEIQPASEPSDIIWENRHFTPAQRSKKSIIVWIVISLALLASFIIIFAGRKSQKAVATRYPPVDCEPFYENYGTGDSLYQFAFADYSGNQKLIDEGKKTSYQGYMQCYCNYQASEF